MSEKGCIDSNISYYASTCTNYINKPDGYPYIGRTGTNYYSYIGKTGTNDKPVIKTVDLNKKEINKEIINQEPYRDYRTSLYGEKKKTIIDKIKSFFKKKGK